MSEKTTRDCNVKSYEDVDCESDKWVDIKFSFSFLWQCLRLTIIFVWRKTIKWFEFRIECLQHKLQTIYVMFMKRTRWQRSYSDEKSDNKKKFQARKFVVLVWCVCTFCVTPLTTVTRRDKKSFTQNQETVSQPSNKCKTRDTQRERARENAKK